MPQTTVEMLKELIIVISTICQTHAVLDTKAAVMEAFRQETKCHAYYAKCMEEKYGTLEMDHLKSCMKERK